VFSEIDLSAQRARGFGPALLIRLDARNPHRTHPLIFWVADGRPVTACTVGRASPNQAAGPQMRWRPK